MRGDNISWKKYLRTLLCVTVVTFYFITYENTTSAYISTNKYATTTVNIRASPSTKSKIVGTIYWNDRVKIIKNTKEWCQILYRSRKRWICKRYLKNKKNRYKKYKSPSSNTFKSYEDSGCITDSYAIAQGRLKTKYTLDDDTGVYMVGNRYCIALGSYYTNYIGTKVDLVLNNNGKKHILKCIAADSKADKDTIKHHKIHKDGSVVEFVVKSKMLPEITRKMGDISYVSKKFRGRITSIRIYK